MTIHQREKLSALLDGHIEGNEIVMELVDNATERERWFRYQLAGAVMRGEATTQQPFDISAQVAAQVASEAVYSQSGSAAQQQSVWLRVQRWLQNGWVRPAANVAVAAGVAIVAIVGVQNFQRVDDGTVVNNPVAASASSSLQGFETMPLGGVINPVSFNTVHPQAEVQDSDQERRLLQSFFVDHHQQQQLSDQESAENEDPVKEID
ncbi:sigma-E factor negative regulatory protein [Aliidiomarina sp.]|uniref:sigma-E factor negative regulatory protein n=1 Tax=Aliidiomarina sp. TaxID=1872439 RepID=UPI003A4E55CD